MNTNCVMIENMPLIFSIANQTMVNTLRVNNHPYPPTLMHVCVQYTNICICKTIILSLTSMAEQAHHDGSRLWFCFGQWSMHKQNQCARSRSRFDQLMSDRYWGWSQYPTRKPNHLRDQMLSIEVTTNFPVCS